MTDRLGFQCRTCGEFHEGIPSFGAEAPQQIAGATPEEIAKRVSIDNDTCVIDGRSFFIRGCLEIPAHGSPEPFVWGVWVSLSEKSYRRFKELFEVAGRESESPWFGCLFTWLPLYPDTTKLKTMVQLRPVPARPRIVLEPTDHPLAVEQREGISMQRVEEIVHQLLHPPHA